jgi:hypothetical protein
MTHCSTVREKCFAFSAIGAIVVLAGLSACNTTSEYQAFDSKNPYVAVAECAVDKGRRSNADIAIEACEEPIEYYVSTLLPKIRVQGGWTSLDGSVRAAMIAHVKRETKVLLNKKFGIE